MFRALAEDPEARVAILTGAGRAFSAGGDMSHFVKTLDDADFAPAGVAKATAGFHALHRQRFSYDEPEVPVEIVALRLKAVGRLAKPVPAQGIETKVDDTAPTRRVHGRHGAVATPVRKRATRLCRCDMTA